MPVIKQYCKGSPVIRHNNALDVSTKDNTAAGSTLGATPEEDFGFSYPPATGTPSEFIGFYPAPQQPTFRDIDTTIKRSTDDWSEKMSWNVIYPWMSASVRTPRAETYTNHPDTQVEETCHRFSYYRPIGQAIDQDNDMNIAQCHGGPSSPSFVLNEGAGGFIWLRVWASGVSTAHQTRFHIQNFERGVWHNFTVFSRWEKGPDSSVNGRHLVFVNDKIARIHNRSGSAGSYTFEKGQIPKVTGSTGGIDTLNTDVLGDLPIQVVEDNVTVDLLYFKGRTLSDVANFTSFQTKWGCYKSSLGSTYYHDDATINSLLAASTPWEEAILVNPNDSEGAKYILPELRTGVIHTSVALGVVGVGETYEYMFEQLNDGLKIAASDRAIIQSNPELSWFTLENEEPTVPPITNGLFFCRKATIV